MQKISKEDTKVKEKNGRKYIAKEYCKPELAILFSIHNEAEKLRQSLECLIRQSLVNIEILIIDRGSLDHTSQVVQDYINMDARIKFWHTEPYISKMEVTDIILNRCKADYILPLEAGDLLADTFLEELVREIHRYQADVIELSYENHLQEIDSHCHHPRIEKICRNTICNNIIRNIASSIIYDKVYRKSLFKSVPLIISDNFYDDVYVFLKIILLAECYTVLPLQIIKQSYRIARLKDETQECESIGIIYRVLDYLTGLYQELDKEYIVELLHYFNGLMKSMAGEYLRRHEFSGEAQRKLFAVTHGNNISLQVMTDFMLGELRYGATQNLSGVIWIEKKLNKKLIKQNDKIIIYGAGRMGKKIYIAFSLLGFEIVAFADSDVSKQGMRYMELDIIAPEQISNVYFDRIIVAVIAWESIDRKLQSLGFKENEDYFIYGH